MINNKKLRSKKGFTIVELVIVIAVIAILAAVLIPTLTGVVKRANESANLQEANAAYKTFLADAVLADDFDGDAVVVVSKDDVAVCYYNVTKGQFNEEATTIGQDNELESATNSSYTYGYQVGNVTIHVKYQVKIEDDSEITQVKPATTEETGSGSGNSNGEV